LQLPKLINLLRTALRLRSRISSKSTITKGWVGMSLGKAGNVVIILIDVCHKQLGFYTRGQFEWFRALNVVPHDQVR
jgi:hypothetical protein